MGNVLVGKTITAMKIADDKQALLFVLGDAEVIVKVDADCCSMSWVESVELPALGFPATVISVEDLEMPDPKDYDATDFDVLAFYGCKITTNKGEIIIDYRNDSNGYYGGDLSWPGENSYFYGGVSRQNVSKENWVEIEE